MADMLSLRGVEKIFATGAQALGGLDLDVREGEFLSLLGPSGCGKSTALRMIAGLSQPTRGSMEWRAGRPEIGFVFQDAVLMPWANVFDNVWLPLRLTGQSRAQSAARIEAALELVGLTGFAKAYPRELSGGMKMRVSIARAMVLRPALLLMDEPSVGLAPMVVAEIFSIIRQLHQEGVSLFIVEQNAHMALKVAQHFYLMEQGRVSFSGSPGEMADDDLIQRAYLGQQRPQTVQS